MGCSAACQFGRVHDVQLLRKSPSVVEVSTACMAAMEVSCNDMISRSWMAVCQSCNDMCRVVQHVLSGWLSANPATTWCCDLTACHRKPPQSPDCIGGLLRYLIVDPEVSCDISSLIRKSPTMSCCRSGSLLRFAIATVGCLIDLEVSYNMHVIDLEVSYDILLSIQKSPVMSHCRSRSLQRFVIATLGRLIDLEVSHDMHVVNLEVSCDSQSIRKSPAICDQSGSLLVAIGCDCGCLPILMAACHLSKVSMTSSHHGSLRQHVLPFLIGSLHNHVVVAEVSCENFCCAVQPVLPG